MTNAMRGTRPMNIAMVSEHASPLVDVGDVDAGGQNVHVASLAAALARRGHNVEVATRRDDPDLPRVVESPDGYRVRHVDAGPPHRLAKDALLPYMPAFSRQLIQAWTRNMPDLVHAHFWMSGLAANRAARVVGIPVAQTFHALGVVKKRHQGSADTSPALRAATEVMLTRQVDRIIATCSDEVFELRRMGLEGDRVDTIPCGVDLTHFRPTGEVLERSERARVVTVSRLVPRKGVDDAIRAIALVPDVELLIAGGPESARMETDPEVRRLRSLALENGVSERVRFLGPVDREHMPALLRSADALLALPWYEPFGITPVESAACGIPVVAAAVGGLTDTVVHEVTGLLVPPRDPEHAAAALRRLFSDDALRNRLGREAAERANRKYGWDRIAEMTESSYERAIEGAAMLGHVVPTQLRGSA